MTRCNSPPETISKPQPLSLSILRIEILLNDLTAKQTKLLEDVKDSTYASTCLSRVFFEYT